MNQKYRVELSEAQRRHLEKLISSGQLPARTLTHAFVLLKSDSSAEGPGWKYEQICLAFNISQVTVMNIRKRYIEKGLEAALERKKPDREYAHTIDGESEAYLIALACGEVPDGKERWSLRLLQDRFIKLGYVDTVSHETIRTTLKKTNLSLG